MSYLEHVAELVVDRSRFVIVAMVLLTVLLGAGISSVGMAGGSLGSDSPEHEAYDYATAAFGTDEVQQTLVVVRGDDPLGKDALEAQLRAEAAMVADDAVAETIRSDYSVMGVANAVALAGIVNEHMAESGTDEVPEEVRAIQQALAGSDAERAAAARDGRLPTLAEQQAQLSSMSQADIDRTLKRLLASERTASMVEALLPRNFDAGALSAESTLLVVTHDGRSNEEGRLAAYDSIREIAEGEFATPPAVFSQDRMNEEVGQSTGDSLLLVGPLALLLTLLALAIAYRDLLDIILGFAGVVVVLVWMAGFMGWAGIDFHFLFVAIPLMLVGLAIDYSIHLVMRYREECGQKGDDGSFAGRPRVQSAMKRGLAGVLGAFLWVTATTTTGFLSNLVSNIAEIREFGLVLAAGILSTFVVFSTLMPALKVELDGWFVERGFFRTKLAFGTAGSLRRLLESAGRLATTRPVAVLVIVLLVSVAGVYGTTQVDTGSDMQMFAPEQPPSWMSDLPEPFAPGEYQAVENVDVVESQFVRDDRQGWVLVRGNVTHPGTLAALARGHDTGADSDLVVNVAGPLSKMERVAAENASFNRTLVDATANPGSGRTLPTLYDEFSATAPDEASEVLHEEDGSYQAMRVLVSVEPGASTATIDAETRAIAAAIESDELSTTPTGRPIAAHTAQTNSQDAAIEGVVITVVVILALLTAGYRRLHGSWTLGGVTLVPMMLLLTWVFGTMALLDVPLNALTAVIASFTVALGVDYSIHISERFSEELEKADAVGDAITRSLVGTGGALAGSALTTAAAFGILAIAINPALKQFGVVMGLTVVYAFIGAVLVLPSLLVVWARVTDESEKRAAHGE